MCTRSWLCGRRSASMTRSVTRPSCTLRLRPIHIGEHSGSRIEWEVVVCSLRLKSTPVVMKDGDWYGHGGVFIADPGACP
jgi:hypothetical protein